MARNPLRRAPGAFGSNRVRIGVEQLEDRTAPALFTTGATQTSTQLNNNGHVVAGFWNSDANLDIVMTNYGPTTSAPGKTITFAYGDGTGKFSGYTSLAVGAGNDHVSFLAAGDLNNDGFQDIVTVQTNTTTEAGTMTVFLGSAIGAFSKTAAGQIGSGGARASWVGITDMDKDGNRDVVVVNLGMQTGGAADGRSVAVFKGDGAGGLVSFQKIDIPLANGVATAGAIADFNGDTYPDFAITFANVPPDSASPQVPGSVRVFLSKADGTVSDFASSAEYDSGGPLPISIAAGDFTGDGKPDLVVANAGDPDNNGFYAQFGLNHAITTLGNGGTGAFAPTGSYTVGFNSPFAVALRDVNLDGRPDIVAADIGKPASLVTGSVLGGVFVLLKDATLTGFLNEASGLYTSPADAPQYHAVGDFTGDGVPDVALVHESNKILTYTNTTRLTTTALAATPTAVSFGQTVTLTATVTANTGGTNPSAGTVTFFDGTTQLGTPQAVTGSGVATLAVTTLSVGAHANLTARFNGTTPAAGAATFGFAAGTSAPAAAVTVGGATAINTATALAANPTASAFGQSVTFTATVTPTSGGNPATGTVTFFDGAAQLGTPQALSGGAATLTTSALSVAAHSITARYDGNASFNTSTSPATAFTVSAAGTGTVLGSSLNPSTFGQSVTFTATVTVTAPGAGTPAGTVTFFDNGTAVSGAVALNGSGVATFPTSTLAVGVHPITAVFTSSSTTIAGGTSGVLSQTVNATANVNTATSVGTTGTPATVTQAVTFTATVTVPVGSPTATGTVTFFDNGTAISGAVPLAGNTAQFVKSDLALGAHAITATYTPTGAFNGSNSNASPLPQQVNPANTGVGLGSSSVPSFVGQTVTFTATVTAAPAIGLPTGSVTFFDGATAISSPIPLANVGGQMQASFPTSTLAVGGHTITAQFAANGNFAGSTSGAISQTVNKTGTTITALSTTSTPAAVGQAVTFTATIVSNGAGTPAGTITFTANGTPMGTGTISSGTATFTTSALPAGTYTVTAAYAGDATFNGSTSGTLSQVVNGVSPPPPVLIGFREFAVGAGATGSSVGQFFNPDGSKRFSFDPFPGFTGGVRVTSADFNGDKIADVVAGTGPGGATRVRVFDGKTQQQLFSVDPFEAAFTGGVYVSTGDLNGDGVPELVISPDEGGGPRVRVFDGTTFGVMADFFGIDDAAFRGGARTGVGDVNGDGAGDLVVAAGFGGGPRVSVISGPTVAGSRTRLFNDFFVFEQALRNGAFIAAGDVDGDGKAELLAGGGPGGGPRVTAFSGAGLLGGQQTAVVDFFAGNIDNRGGVRLAARDLDGDNLTDFVVGDGTGAGSRVTAYMGKNMKSGSPPLASFSFDAYPGFNGGVYVG